IALSDRHGSRWWGTRVGTPVSELRAHGAADGREVRIALPTQGQERRKRCRGNLRGGGAPWDALRTDQGGRAASSAFSSASAARFHRGANGGAQSSSWTPGRVWRRAATAKQHHSTAGARGY